MPRITPSGVDFVKIAIAAILLAVLGPIESRAGDSVPDVLIFRVSSGAGQMITVKTLRFDEIDDELERGLAAAAAECIRIGAPYGGELYKDRILLELCSNGYQVAVFSVLENRGGHALNDAARLAYKHVLSEAKARYEHYHAFGDLPYRIDDKSRLIKAW